MLDSSPSLNVDPISKLDNQLDRSPPTLDLGVPVCCLPQVIIFWLVHPNAPGGHHTGEGF